MDLPTVTEHSRQQKFKDTKCACILHNLVLRFRMELEVGTAARADLDAYYNELVEAVDIELALVVAARVPAAVPVNPTAVVAARREEVVNQLWTLRNTAAARAAAP